MMDYPTPKVMERLYFYVLLSQIVFIGIQPIDSAAKTAFARDVKGKPICFDNLLLPLKNSSFSASSVWRNAVEFEPHMARMLSMVESAAKQTGQAWCPNDVISDNRRDWLEVDLGVLHFVVHLFTYGRGDGNFEEYVPFFYLDYQRENGQWIQYRKINGQQLLIANSDSRNAARTRFELPILARRLRLYPISRGRSRRACIRITIYGCPCRDGVVSYNTSQGYLFDNKDRFDLRDISYDINTRTVANSVARKQLQGGIGQLVDNIVFLGTLEKELGVKDPGFHLVGWNRKQLGRNQLVIDFKLFEVRAVKHIQLFCLNMLPKNIGVFSKATVHFSVGGLVYDYYNNAQAFTTALDHRVYHSRWIQLPIATVLARFVRIELQFELDWLVMSEIILETSPTELTIRSEPVVEDKTSKKPVDTQSQPGKTSTKGGSAAVAVTVVGSRSRNNNGSIGSNNDYIGGGGLAAEDNGDGLRHPMNPFSPASGLGLVAIVASGLLGLLLLTGVVCLTGLALKRHRRLRRKKKGGFGSSSNGGGKMLLMRHPNRDCNGSSAGGALLGEPGDIGQGAMPFSFGTHSSSGGGSTYYRHTDAFLNYPVMGHPPGTVCGPPPGRDYTTTVSSRSGYGVGADYDVAGAGLRLGIGSSSVDGLLQATVAPCGPATTSKRLSQHAATTTDQPYTTNPYTRNSIDGSIGGSSNTDYASASLYHLPTVVMDTDTPLHYYPQQHLQHHHHQQQQQAYNKALHRLSTNTATTSLPASSCSPSLRGGTNHSPTPSPFRIPCQQPPSRFLYNGDMCNSVASTAASAAASAAADNLTPIDGIFGSSAMLLMDSAGNRLETPTAGRGMDESGLPFSSYSMTLGPVLSALSEIDPSRIDKISMIGCAQNGSIGFMKVSLDNKQGSPKIEDMKLQSSDSKMIYGERKPEVNAPRHATFLFKSLNSRVTSHIRQELVQELSVLGRLQHPSFLPLVAYTLDPGRTWLQAHLSFLFELHEGYENLHSFLSRVPQLDREAAMTLTNCNRSCPTQPEFPSHQWLLHICREIAVAMRYLECQGIVHRDLATRNCLIASHQKTASIKVTDVAITTQIFQAQYTECISWHIQTSEQQQQQCPGQLAIHRYRLPLRWMAPETIMQGIYSSKTDVWSFGVTMWEILSFCERLPYETTVQPTQQPMARPSFSSEWFLHNASLLLQSEPQSLLPSGVTFEYGITPLPIGVPALTELIRDCWHRHLVQRPSFSQVVAYLSLQPSSVDSQ